MISQTKFFLAYETGVRLGGPMEDDGLPQVDLDDPNVYSTLENDFDSMSKYFSHPSYMTIDGAPILYLYASKLLEKGSISNLVSKLRDHLKQNGFNLYLIGQEFSYNAGVQYPIDIQRLKTFDASTNWLPVEAGTSVPLIRERYLTWQTASRSAGIEFIPFSYPGFDDRQEAGVTPEYVHRSPEFLSECMKTAMDFLDRDQLLFVRSFNEWGENDNIEPSVSETGILPFAYLDTIRDTLGAY
jgi:hypothetical protein